MATTRSAKLRVPSRTAATAARHEVSEATSDPQLNAWFDGASGEETSDKCNFNYGPRTWDFVGGQFVANYMWGGFFFLLQQFVKHLDCAGDTEQGIACVLPLPVE